MTKDIVCRLKHFSLSFQKGKAWYPAVDDISMEIHEGEMAALIGESGCGKSMTALSLLGLEPEGTRTDGEILFQKNNLLKLNRRQWENLRGTQISMIFQEPMTALNPLVRVGKQILESLTEHDRKISKKEAKQKVLAMMKQVGLPDVEALYESYPHQLSGGQRQRIMIAMACMNHPKLLVADEPTTALDVTVQAQIMELMRKMNKELGTAVLLISHDLGVVKNLCDYVYIMYAGHIVEAGEVGEILKSPMHPYTKGLAAASPSAKLKGKDLASIPGSVPAIDQREKNACAFCGRCSKRMEICDRKKPPVREYQGRKIMCHLSIEEMLTEENHAG